MPLTLGVLSCISCNGNFAASSLSCWEADEERTAVKEHLLSFMLLFTVPKPLYVLGQ